MATLKEVCSGLPLEPLPSAQTRDCSVPHAPKRNTNLSKSEEIVREKYRPHVDTTQCFVLLLYCVPYVVSPFPYNKTFNSVLFTNNSSYMEWQTYFAPL